MNDKRTCRERLSSAVLRLFLIGLPVSVCGFVILLVVTRGHLPESQKEREVSRYHKALDKRIGSLLPEIARKCEHAVLSPPITSGSGSRRISGHLLILHAYSQNTVRGRPVADRPSAEIFDDIYYRDKDRDGLPGRLWLRATDQPRVVVWVVENDVEVGHYNPGGAPAYRVDFDVYIIDLLTRRVLAHKFFKGDMPRAVKESSGMDVGRPPMIELRQWLMALSE